MKIRKLTAIIVAMILIATLFSAVFPAQAVTMTYTPTDSYKSGSYYTALCNVQLTGNQRTDILNIALSQVGYTESNSFADLAGNAHGYGDYTEYGYWYSPSHPNYAWCGIFISWCARQAGIPTSVIARTGVAAAGNLVSTYYNYSSSALIQPGDLVHIKNSYGNHVALVRAVDSQYIYTVEGNMSDSVKLNYYVRSTGYAYYGSSEYIAYYSCPQYTTLDMTAPSTLKLSNAVYPSGNYPTMSSFALKGTFTSNYPITKVSAKVLNSNNIPVLSYEKVCSSTTYNIATDGVDANIIFGDLPANLNYTYQVQATDLSGKTVTKTSAFSVGDTSISPPTSTLKLTGAVYPSGNYATLRSFGLSGVFQSNYAIVSVSATIQNKSGTALQSFQTAWVNKTFDIDTNGVDDAMVFGNLPTNAEYTYKVQATDASGKTVSKSSAFSIGDPTYVPPASTLKLTSPVAPSGLYGTLPYFGLSGTFSSNYTITSVTAQILNESGTAVQTYTKAWNSTTYNIASNGVDDNMIFGTLPTNAQYTYKVQATDSSGKTVSYSSAFAIGTVTHSVTYNANGGTNAPAGQTKIYGTALTLSATIPTRSRYQFLGWATNASATAAAYQPGTSYTAEKNITLYAVWQKIIVPGDFNDDGYANAADAVSLQQMLLGKTALTDAADTNGDGVKDVRDLVHLKRLLA